VIGVLTGLRAEARCLEGLDLKIACSGARPERAQAEATRLLAEGAKGLVSFGLAAGLDPGLRPGDLVLADVVITPDGQHLATDAAWRNRLVALLAKAGVDARARPVVGTERLLVTSQQKRALLEMTSASAADMESHVVAQAASAAGKPFVVIRAISDGADQALPDAALRFLGAEGRIRPTTALSVISRPWELVALLRLGLQTRHALSTLHEVARNAGNSLERPFNRSRPAAETETSGRRSRAQR
jgi:adenosylhomocysteine nucleosidase